MGRSLRVCFVASEAAPLAKTGGLADVSSALPRYLHRGPRRAALHAALLAHRPRERSSCIRSTSCRTCRSSSASHRYRFSVFIARMPGSQADRSTSSHCPRSTRGPGIYTRRRRRAPALPAAHARGVRVPASAWASRPDILHCNDWHTAFGPLYLQGALRLGSALPRRRAACSRSTTSATRASSPPDAASDVGLGDEAHLLHQDDLRAGRINSLKHGILYADAITTVSPTYAREIRTDQYGMGLQDTLRARGGARASGILNGVDYDEWNPRHDRYLPHHYDARSLAREGQTRKRELAERLQSAAGRAHGRSLGIVSAPDRAEGLRPAVRRAARALSRSAILRFVALGNGELHYERVLHAASSSSFPGRVVYHRGYNDELAHWIEAASDMFLMPSLYEPCGLNQMYSLRYGTVPIVRRTGGLADSVQLLRALDTGQGTGIVFDDFNAPGDGAGRWTPRSTCTRQPEHWRRMMLNGMAQDFSWERQGAQYVALRALGTARSRLSLPPAMNVIFVEPAFPYNQREFVRGLHAVGATRHRHRRASARVRSTASSSTGSTHYEQVALGGARTVAARGRAAHPAPRLGGSPRGDGRGAHHADREGARGVRHSRHLGAHRLAVPRQAVDEGGAARGRHSVRAIDERRRPGSRRARSRHAVGFPLILKPRAGAGASGTMRVDDDAASSSTRCRRYGRRTAVASIAIEEFIEGHEGFLDTHRDRRRGGARIRQPLLPERARGDARALDLTADRLHQPRGRARLRRGEATWRGA